MAGATPVMMSLAGLGAPAQGAGTAGVAGLFSALMGGEGLGGADGSLEAVMAGFSQSGGQVQGEVSLDALLGGEVVQVEGGAPVQVEGEATAVQDFLQFVQKMLKQLEQLGVAGVEGLGSASELGEALTQLGMEPAEAEALAQRIDTMLDLIKQQLDLDDKTEGTLAAMMMAAMVGQQEGQLQGVSVTVTTVEQLTVKVASLRTVGAFAAVPESDVLGELVGRGGVKDGEEKPEVGMLDVANTGEADGTPRKVVIEIVRRDEGVGIAVAFPRAMEREFGVIPQAALGGGVVSSEVADVINRPVVEAVSKDRVIERPKGETLFAWRADKNGVESLVAVAPAGQSGEALLNLGQRSEGGELAAAREGIAGERFAEQVRLQELVQRAREAGVGHQVALQMKPLAEQGGGVVRMTLNPEELGRVDIEIKVVDGVVQGSISATQSGVVEQLARELHSLRQGLADSGLKLGEQGISLMLNANGGQGFDQRQAGHQQGQGRRAGAGDADLAVLEVDDAAGWVSAERVVDVRI